MCQALCLAGALSQAQALYAEVLKSEPRHYECLHMLGVIAARAGDPARAVEWISRAIGVEPKRAAAYCNRGLALERLERPEAALTDYDAAIALDPGYAPAHLNRGIVLEDLGRWQEALAAFDRAIALDAGLAEAHFNRAAVLERFTRPHAALESYERAMSIMPRMEFLRGPRRHTKMQLCDWDGFAADLAELCAAIERGEAACAPFAFLALSGSAALQRRAAEIWARERGLLRNAPRAPLQWGRHEKIRIGYFSADFRSHPVARLTAELFEMHDRGRFEVTAFAWGPDTPDPMRKRLRAAFDRFIDVDRSSAEEIARLARQMELDIAVDLGGYTRDSRPGIFAARAAPVQVTFLGYPGTLGAPFMDYLVADRALVPPDQLRHYSEKILHLPSYQPNDATRRIARSRIARSARGGLCVLLLQRQLQDHAGGIRCLDADTEERSGQRPVVAQRG